MIVAFLEAIFNAYQAVLVFRAHEGIAAALPRIAVATGCATVLIMALAMRKRLTRLSGQVVQL